MKERNKRVLVGMSGGIDSTATCLMLQEQGYEIVGVTMRVWGDEPQDARELAARMGIEHYVADERIPFKETIVRNFIDEYKQGRTPNPCVMCNPLFKFRVLAEWADKLNCAYIATGHYARIEQLPNGRYAIKNSVTAAKDQPYALYNLTQEQLAQVTGINQANISRLENGTANPSLRTLKRLAEGMGMELKLEFVPRVQPQH